jgi:hypothetical protein
LASDDEWNVTSLEIEGDWITSFGRDSLVSVKVEIAAKGSENNDKSPLQGIFHSRSSGCAASISDAMRRNIRA